jgi:hypothetical protein
VIAVVPIVIPVDIVNVLSAERSCVVPFIVRVRDVGTGVNPSAFCFPLNVFQSVDDKAPVVVVFAVAMLKVLFADKSPPPLKGAVVEIVRVVGT